jgi:hypothetical protein
LEEKKMERKVVKVKENLIADFAKRSGCGSSEEEFLSKYTGKYTKSTFGALASKSTDF